MKAATKRHPRSEKTKTQILDTAFALIRERGFEETTMRAIAEKANVALGASYYYFSRKEELIFSYYLRLQEEEHAQVPRIVEHSKKFEDRMRALMIFKFAQLARDRALVLALTKTAADPRGELSPLSPETYPIRKKAIEHLRKLIDGSDLTVHKSLHEKIDFVFWLYYMGLIFLWAHDRSENQKFSFTLLDQSLPLLLKLLALTNLPLTGIFTKAILKILSTIESFMAPVAIES